MKKSELFIRLYYLYGMKKNQALLGLYCAILYFAWKLALFYTGNQYEILPKFPVAPLLGLLGIAIIYSVTKLSPEPFTPIDGFKSGVRTALVAAIVTTVFVFIYYSFVDPAHFSQQNAEIRAAIEAFTDEKQRKEALVNFENNKKFFEPFNYSALTMSGVAAFGMLFSIITAGLYEMFRKFSSL